METIELELDKENELVFNVTVEGTSPATTRYRFLIESSDFSLNFPGLFNNGELSVTIPPMEKMLVEGKYTGTLEVIVDDKIFTPLTINTMFNRAVRVVAESVVNVRRQTSVSASSSVAVRQKNIKNNSDSNRRPTRQPGTRPELLKSMRKEEAVKEGKKSLESIIESVMLDKKQQSAASTSSKTKISESDLKRLLLKYIDKSKKEINK